MIEHDNIIYVYSINSIGGVETFAYELAKKYKDNDIAIVCKMIAKNQLKRLRKLCNVYIHTTEQINCKVIITNWDTSILKYVNKDAKVYTVLHTDYSHSSQTGLPIDDPRITYIGITEDSMKKFQSITKIDRTILCRNPLTLEKEEKPLILMSASRLTKEKGGHRLLALANALDRLKIKYIWFIFTTNEYSTNPVWNNKNIIHMENRLDLDFFYNIADWYIQCSEVEGDSYSLKEALYRGKPIVACELPYFKEIGIENNKNALFLDLDCENVNEVAEKMQKPLKFTFEPIKDEYDKIIVKGKSHYKEDLDMRVKVKVLQDYKDLLLNKDLKKGNEYETDRERADHLVDLNLVEIVEVIKEEKKETKKVPTKKVEKK